VFLKSASRRIAMAMPFLLLSAVVLGLWGTPRLPASDPALGDPPLVIILTTKSLSPAFRALETWNEAQGCRIMLVTVRDEEAREHPERVLASLREVSLRGGVTGLLLGADHRLLPLPSRSGIPVPTLVPSAWAEEAPLLAPLVGAPDVNLPSGLSAGRAEVRSLPEAWAFVEFCQRTGETLDVLLQKAQLRAGNPEPLLSPLYARAASPVAP